ncbi:MAG: hypothetical protein ACD_39C02073G0004 [uncultured bacterium]|nr:MAG: hypothetical protein ACD_39C02073G0004 [uncultured bacterium]
MKLIINPPLKSLSKAYLKQSLKREQIELFKANLARMFERICSDEHEEHLKNIVSDFLKDTWYKQTNEINTSGRADLVIHNGTTSTASVGVLIEVKRPSNKNEMISPERPNAKALHELLHYYMQERYIRDNKEIRHLIICNIHEWYIFDAVDFERFFFHSQKLVKSYKDWNEGLLVSTNTDWFYQEIAKPFIEKELDELPCSYFNLKDFERIIRKPAQQEDSKLIALYKVFSPAHLLKQSFSNDSNSLNREFYSELLHILGLEEVKEKGKKLIRRKPEGSRNDGSLLENTCNFLKTRGRLSALSNLRQYGADADEHCFSVALELCITWLNRLLFLKLLEGQLIGYHKGDRSYAFLNSSRIGDFDELNELFFEVLAVRIDERSESVRGKFGNIPYLNSSLFEESDLERATMRINELKNRLDLPLHSATVLKGANGKRLTGSKSTLGYMFEYLDAYDFGAEGSADIQEQNKSIINASVLGLIFEKINGYKDGSFFTPGFITMYICRETIRRTVVNKFNEKYGWNCANLTELHNNLYRQSIPLTEANAMVNSLKICDPAVGSGHFLVSALNEIIAIKSELRILVDSDGKLLRCDVAIENDELIVTVDDHIFEYHYKDAESQRIQETLFHEKETIIENCLFGVDINPKSVAICRLRLWIELLKNAYYRRGSDQLETLPNIDINIKCGNSLVSRFAISGNPNILPGDRKKMNELTEKYRRHVFEYKLSPANKALLRKEIDNLKHSLENFGLPNDKDLIALWKSKDELAQLSLFGFDKKEQERRKKLHEKVDELERRFEEKQRLVYSNAFEWRFEFPEVLDENGEFVGFDLVVGNPPYGVSFTTEEKQLLKNSFSSIHVRTPESYNYFIGRFAEIANAAGSCGLIIPSSFLSQIEFEKTRRFLIDKHSIQKIINLGDGVFQDVSTPTCVVIFQLPGTNNKIVYNDLTAVDRKIISASLDSNRLFFDSESIKQNEGYSFIYKRFGSIIDKCYQNVSLKQIAEDVATGISPGLGEAFVIDINKSNKLNLEHELLKKLVIGGEINKFTLNPSSNKLIIYCTSNTDIARFGNCFSYLEKYKEKLEKRVETLSGTIPWFVMLRPRRIKLFEKPKILIRQTANRIIAAYDDQGWYCLKSGIIVQLPDDSEIYYFYLLALLNSKLMDFIYRDLVNEDNRIFPEVKPIQLFKLPIKIANKLEQAPIIERVQKILVAPDSPDVPRLEAEIDRLVYDLYGLTDEEIATVEGRA